jgi:tRNA threonylcarbamoyladenosine biosynthesis protein TsaE
MKLKSATFTIQNLSELEVCANRFAKTLRPGDRILILGPMGVGKTTWVGAILRALGLAESFQGSPTFPVVQSISLNPAIYHMDWYRVERESELEYAGIFEQLSDPQALAFVEWAEKFPKVWEGFRRVKGLRIREVRLEFYETEGRRIFWD